MSDTPRIWTDDLPAPTSRLRRLNYPGCRDLPVFQRVIQPATGYTTERQLRPGHQLGVTTYGAPLFVRDIDHDGRTRVIELTEMQP